MRKRESRTDIFFWLRKVVYQIFETFHHFSQIHVFEENGMLVIILNGIQASKKSTQKDES